MKIILIFSVFLTSLVSIANSRAGIQPALKDTTIAALKQRRALLRTWAPKCADGSLTMHTCPFYDSIEYSGMLCLSGETDYCDPVRRAQGSDGRWYRSEGFMGSSNPDVLSFSNDMDRGVWAYIVATGDREAALRYMNYTKSIGYHLCPKTETHWEACSMRATYWPFARDVFEWLGLPLDHRKMKDYKIWIDTIYSPIEARLQPVTFQMILTAEHVYTLRKLKEKGAKIHNEGTYARIAKIIHKRDPENPFYDFLANGPNEGAAEKILRLCPTTKPEVPVVNGAPQYTEPANGPWEKGSGHYCIFMINAILGSAI